MVNIIDLYTTCIYIYNIYHMFIKFYMNFNLIFASAISEFQPQSLIKTFIKINKLLMLLFKKQWKKFAIKIGKFKNQTTVICNTDYYAFRLPYFSKLCSLLWVCLRFVSKNDFQTIQYSRISDVCLFVDLYSIK